ncbi:hypothetical protein [Microvirga sp. VF16]|uniref:hypothetical protein n=1 Tax=Microvirga sp. VF16 TaxID=2807101 RepID=UPI00193CF2A1|nr:hypothetical protein [Microvirga sp. VF16]QRM35001.1 hypothetical protein JO965_42840 [Microvirga sp. VF16]
MSNPVIEIPEDLRDKLLLVLNDHPKEEVQLFLDKLRKDSLRDFKGLLVGLSNLPGLSAVNRALQASWWFIENVPENDWRRNEIYFELRNLVRQVPAQKQQATERKPNSFIRFECGREDRFSENHGPFEFVQATYGTIRVDPDGDREIAHFKDGLWHTEDGQAWTDFVMFSEASSDD